MYSAGGALWEGRWRREERVRGFTDLLSIEEISISNGILTNRQHIAKQRDYTYSMPLYTVSSHHETLSLKP